MSSAGDAERPATVAEVLRSLAFYLAFWGGTVLYVLAATAALPFSQRAFRATVRNWGCWQRACARVLLGLRVRAEGAAAPGPALYAFRHESFFEAIDLPVVLTEPVIFAKVQLTRLPMWGFAARKYGVVPVERDQGAKALRAMVAAARAYAESGRPLAIFPEGTRVRSGDRRELQSGFAGLYKLLGLPVVPVAVDSGRFYHRWWKRAGVVSYRFAEPIPPGLPRAEVEARVFEAINALNGPPCR